MKDQLLKDLTGCSVAEKAEIFQALAVELFAFSGSSAPVPVCEDTGAVLGYFVPAEDDGLIDIDINAGVPEIASPGELVPIEDVLAESLGPPV